jgi:dipeptidyl aminopeptidase/acylaminoacyl peptidase
VLTHTCYVPCLLLLLLLPLLLLLLLLSCSPPRPHPSQLWILGYTSDSVNSKYYMHRPGTWPPELLFDTQPSLLPYSTAKMHGVVIPARDGLKLPAYLTLPVKHNIPATLPKCVAGVVPDLSSRVGQRRDVAVERSDARQRGECSMELDLPMVLYVHGGPWSRDTWGSDPTAQLLANRGYALLQVNYRASSGYGKRFMNLGDKQWGVGSMQHDLTDSVKWAVAKGIADPKKICIMGGSYGGYATLAGLTFTPDLYACGLDLVGISNVGTFMRSIPPYWQPLRFEWATRVGPADTDEAFNHKISPMYHVDKIRAPLFIAQGAHDPRVPQAESDQMFKAMFTKGLPVKYVLYTDEGHGIAKPDNRMDYYSRVEQYLAKYLGGRSEAPLAIEGVSAVEVKDLKDLAAVAPKKTAKSDAPEVSINVRGSNKAAKNSKG